jgi:general secretion pathway protein F
MPAYSFEAVDAQGSLRKGVIDAETARAARGALRAQTLVPLQVTQVGAGADDDADAADRAPSWFAGRVFGAAGLAVWTRQLAGLVSASLPLERALTALGEEADDPRQRNLVAALRAEVNAGSGFAKALARYPREFSSIYVAVIDAGEHSGALGLVLERLADDLAEQQQLKSRLIGAALYPAIVTVIAIAIVMFLVAYVVPQVAGVFAGTKQSLPWLTEVMLAGSALVRDYGLLVLAALLLALAGFRYALRSIAVRERFDAAFLRLPLIGRLARGYNAARFANTLAMLASAGVPILKALQAAAETLNNRAMRADALAALVLVREGAPIALALARNKRFPPMLPMFARLGEQTGQLPLMLQRVATQLSADVQRRAMQLATILEPLLIVAMGLAVMLIVLAVMLPIIQLNTLVR